MPEEVLAIPTSRLDSLGRFDGVSSDRRYLDAFREARFLPRDAAEDDATWRQVIPYVVVESADGVFSYARARSGREKRLHDLRSIGVGGHINPSDLPGGLPALVAAPLTALAAGARREIEEEVVGAADADLEWFGLLRDDASEVGRVHVGAVFLGRVSGSVTLTGEGRMLEPRCHTWSQLALAAEQYEGWSRHVIAHVTGERSRW